MLWLVLAERTVPRTRCRGSPCRPRLARWSRSPSSRRSPGITGCWPPPHRTKRHRAHADLASYLMPPENTFAGRWLLAHGVKGPRWIWGEQTLYLGWAALLAWWVSPRRSGRGSRLTSLALLRRARDRRHRARGGTPEVRGSCQRLGWSPFRHPRANSQVPTCSPEQPARVHGAFTTPGYRCPRRGGHATLHARFGRGSGRVLTVVAMPIFLGRIPPCPAASRAAGSLSCRFPTTYSSSPACRRADRLVAGLRGHTVAFDEANYQFFSTAR